ncbi:BatA domain-containing protein [Luteolibacter pohnpeiensis]|uniref:BatA domain-containing protein n=1 Tax=Luteolibacter pohnpeiensis TaxID=454153 RepID=A0A934S2E3_9BACT|nr:BatA domain-containing protein [Luteolibacter pohnpeiensis]MBK1881171.1 BatA domain-containing protein [Luteolibacter pohnpeiensis]
MIFLSPLFLWFVAAAAVPIAIHLLNKRRHKTIPWAAMSFLLKATRESRGKKKLRHILILTCRALALAALALAAARPVASGLLGWGAGRLDTVVLILDRSASMEAKPGDGLASQRELVLEKVKKTLADLGSPRLVLIDSASASPTDVPSPDTLAELSSTAATDSEADFPRLLSKAAEFLTETSGRSEVWIASDLQSSNWHPADERWAAARASLSSLPKVPAIRILSLTQNGGASNTSLRLISSRRSGDELLLDLELLRDENARGTISIPVTSSLNGARTTELLTVPGQSLRFQKRVTLPEGSESGYGHLSIPADGNPRDNVAFFAYGPAMPVRSVIVSAEGEAAQYLALAAAPPGFGEQSVERVEPDQFSAVVTNDLSLILWNAPLPDGAAAESLNRYLSAGGQVLFFPPGQASSESFLEHKWSAPVEAASGKFLILKDWNHADGPMRDGIDGTSLPAERMKAIRCQIPQGDSAPLARWEDGEPFLTRRVTDRGIAWFIGSKPDYTWSNLGDADVLLPVVQRILELGAARFDASHTAEIGSDAAALLPGEIRERIDDYGTPDPANAAYESGVYRLGSRVVAVNRPAAEDAPELLTRDELDDVLEGTSYTLLEQAGQATTADLSRDLWMPFLIAVLAFLIFEAILCLPKKRDRSTPLAATS